MRKHKFGFIEYGYGLLILTKIMHPEKNIYMHFGHWDLSVDPIKQTVLTEVYIMESTIVHNSSGSGGEVVHPQGWLQ